MAIKYSKTGQTGDAGIAIVQSIAVAAGVIFRPFSTTDLGIDGAIELLSDNREPSGDLILTQIKAGASYVRGGKFFIDADRDHFETWARYAIPVVGIACNPATGEARWVDITEHLRAHPGGCC